MRRILPISAATALTAVFALCAEGCPPSIPAAPVPPDATDGAPTMAQDASSEAAEPSYPATPCGVACANKLRLCGPTPGDCVRAMSQINSSPGTVREPNGNSLTCLDLASASTVDEIRALGVPCP